MSPNARRAGLALTAASAVFIALLTLVPTDDTSRHAWCIVCGEVGGVDVVLNIALFAPLGAGLALAGARLLRTTGIAALASVTIELLQLVIPSRSATLSDVMTNTAGAALGFWVAANFLALLRPPAPRAARLAIAAGLAWLAVQVMAAFSIVPSIPGPPHRAQTGRGLAATYEPFPGVMLAASVAGHALRAADLPRGRPFFELALREGSVGAVTVVPQECPAFPAALIHVGDTLYRELFILAALERDVVFGVRTGAEALRLGPVRYRARDALGAARSCGDPGDTARIAVSYTRRDVVIEVARAGEDVRIVRHEPRLSQAWGLFVPFLFYRTGGPLERALDIAWIALVLAPVAYWAGAAAAPARRHLAFAAYVAMLGAGLVLVPLTFGLRVTPVFDWSVTLIVSAAVARASWSAANRDVDY